MGGKGSKPEAEEIQIDVENILNPYPREMFMNNKIDLDTDIHAIILSVIILMIIFIYFYKRKHKKS
jgi:ABC-type spermidine/putrescine transport system permease subunit II